MAAVRDAVVPAFPLLWNAHTHPKLDVRDHTNLSLNLDGKGVYLRNLSGQTLATSHRMDLPFPLQSAVTTSHYQPHGDSSSSCDGAALPLLAGDLHKDDDHDPVRGDVDTCQALHQAARGALLASSTFTMPFSKLVRERGLTREGMTSLLDEVKGATVKLPRAAYRLHNAMPLVHFLTRNPVFKGWDEDHNWLYGGGCVAVMNRSQKLLHTCGRNVAVAELAPRADREDSSLCEDDSSQCEDDPSRRPAPDEDTSSRLTCAEDESLLTWPDRETVLQIDATDEGHEMAAVRSVTAGRFYLRTRRRLVCVDQLTPEEPVSAVCCHPKMPQRWALLDTAGRLTIRDSVAGGDAMSVQMPEVERPIGWFGLDAVHRRHQFRAACWERLYTVDTRVPKPVVLFRLSSNTRLFDQRDRLHAVRSSSLRPHLTLLTSSRHLVVIDTRQPHTPWLWSRLTVPPAPVYLSSCPAAVSRGGAGGGDMELVTVASQADNHVQAVVYDWSAGVELGGSRLLGCARPSVEAPGAPGLEAARRLMLPLAGLAVDRPASGRCHVYTTNSCGDVFVHPLVPNDPGEGEGDGGGGDDGGGGGDGDSVERQRDEQATPRENGVTGRSNETPERTKRREGIERRRKRKNAGARREAKVRRQCCHLVSTWSDTVEEQRHQRARRTAVCCDEVTRWPGDLKELLDPPPSELDAECTELPRWCPPGASDPPRARPERTPQRVNKWLNRTPRPGDDSDTEGTPGPGEDQTDRASGPGEDQSEGTRGSEGDLSSLHLRLAESGNETSQAGDASSTDVSTPPQSEIEELLTQWDESDGDGSETEGAVSVTEEFTASALRIPGSQRRSLVPRWQRRRRLSSGSSCVSAGRVSSGASSSRASSVTRSSVPGGESGNESSTSGTRSASSFVTPARPLPAVNQGAAFQQFSLDLFD